MANITGTVNYNIAPDGKTVTITIFSEITGVSTTTAMVGSGVPSILWPTVATVIPSLAIRDVSVGAQGGGVSIPTGSGTWTFSNAPPANAAGFPRAWTASGNKGLLAQVFTYQI